MSERTESGRSVEKSPLLDGGRSRLVLAGAILMLGGAICGFAYRGYVDYNDMIDSNQRVLQSRSENRELKSRIADLEEKLEALQTKLASVQAALNAIMPAENTFSVSPNQSVIVAGGHLTVGLIGTPTIQGVNINVNGKQQSVVAGDIINIALDASTSCQVRVQSFDMFKAVITASCAAVRPQ